MDTMKLIAFGVDEKENPTPTEPSAATSEGSDEASEIV